MVSRWKDGKIEVRRARDGEGEVPDDPPHRDVQGGYRVGESSLVCAKGVPEVLVGRSDLSSQPRHRWILGIRLGEPANENRGTRERKTTFVYWVV